MCPEVGPHWPAEPGLEAVEQQYGDEAELYAEVRSKAAESVGRGSAARQWEEIEAKLATGEEPDDDE